MPHSITHGDACFAYFNKIRGILTNRGGKPLYGLIIIMVPVAVVGPRSIIVSVVKMKPQVRSEVQG